MKGRKMSLIAKATTNSTFTPVPPGMHLARCYRIIDLGTQKATYKGDVKFQPKIMIQFEVHGEDEEGNKLVTEKGEPLSISKNYTLSLGEQATLRKDLQAWRGVAFTPKELGGFELKNILDKWAMITVTKDVGEDGKEYTNIANINPVPGAMRAQCKNGHNEPKMYSISEHDEELFNTFGKRLQEKIALSPEFQAMQKKPGGSGFDDMEDDQMPF
jgi:hypothetical protein